MANSKDPEGTEDRDPKNQAGADASADWTRSEEGAGIFRKGAMGREHSDWTAVLGRLGGSSPGSEENLRLGGIFRRVVFPADRGQVLEKLEPGVEFSVKPGIALDVREAVELSRAPVFRNLNDLIDCIKDALRRADTLERNPT